MKLNRKIIFLSIIVITLMGCTMIQKGIMAVSAKPFPENISSLSEGKKTYINNCLSCHGIQGSGDGISKNLLLAKLPDFTSSAFDKPLSYLAASITYGKHSEMPAFKDKLTEQEIWDVSRYVKSLK